MALTNLHRGQELENYDGSQWNRGNTVIREQLELAFEKALEGEIMAILSGVLHSAKEEFPELMNIEEWVDELHEFLTIAVSLRDAILSLPERSEQELNDLKRIQELIRLCDGMEERMYVLDSLDLNKVYCSYQKAEDLNHLITEAGEFMNDLLRCHRHVMALSKDGRYHNFILTQSASHDQIVEHLATWIQDCMGESRPLHEGIYSLSMNRKALQALQTIMTAQLQSPSKRKWTQDIDRTTFEDIQAFPYEKLTIRKEFWNDRRDIEFEGGDVIW